MKVILSISLLIMMLFVNSVFAHGGDHGHGDISEERAISIAQAVTKAMTFKDRGYSVGKIDTSWNKVQKSAYKLVEEDSSSFIIKATNVANKQTLFVKLKHSGKVVDVKDEGDFIMTHGHDH